MVKHRIWYTVAVAGALVIWIIGNIPEALAFLCLLILVPILLGITQYLALRGFQMEGSIAPICRIGQKIPLTVKVFRKNRIPMGNVTLSGTVKNVLFQSTQEIHMSLSVSDQKEQSWHYLTEIENCGNIYITLTEVTCMDLLGLLAFRIPADIRLSVMAYPARMELQVETDRRPETILGGELYDQNRKGNDVSEVADLRDYVPGDALGSIHWKLSGKLDTLVVREFGYPSNYQVVILYDIIRKADGQEISTERNDAVLALTGALSEQMLKHHMEHHVGRMINGEYLTVPVYSVSTYDDMLAGILCRPVTEEASAGDSIYQFIQKDLRSLYTKLIYITPVYDESTVRQVSNMLDVTVIQVVEKTENTYVDSAGYAVITVGEQEYRDKLYNIVI